MMMTGNVFFNVGDDHKGISHMLGRSLSNQDNNIKKIILVGVASVMLDYLEILK
jgi:hypothetical protein